MKRIFKLIFILAGITLLPSCGGDDPDNPTNTTPSNSNNSNSNNSNSNTSEATKLKINISASLGTTRANDSGFESGDKVGLYVVNYNGNNAGTLMNSGNHVDNMRFTYNGDWNPDSQIYWLDENTHADFYLYHPYASISNVNAIQFNLSADQSTEQKYYACDFLAGKATNVAPTESDVPITVNHLMSQISIELVAGNGFTDESLAASSVAIKINNLLTQSTINLATMEAVASGSGTEVTPWKDGNAYRALIVPQTVEEGNLITVTVDEREFNLTGGFTFESGNLHKFTVTVNKVSNGINVGINQWGDGDQYNGSAE